MSVEDEHELFVFQMRAVDTEIRAYVIAMNDKDVRQCLAAQVVGGAGPFDWTVEDVSVLHFAPHVVCLANGVFPQFKVKKEKDDGR